MGKVTALAPPVRGPERLGLQLLRNYEFPTRFPQTRFSSGDGYGPSLHLELVSSRGTIRRFSQRRWHDSSLFPFHRSRISSRIFQYLAHACASLLRAQSHARTERTRSSQLASLDRRRSRETHHTESPRAF